MSVHRRFFLDGELLLDTKLHKNKHKSISIQESSSNDAAVLTLDGEKIEVKKPIKMSITYIQGKRIYDMEMERADAD